ncbi:MAG: hypothetical protein NO076_06475 [Sulfolobales archaeon]|nr:hypothetical protein [Sulfolobales archaeon]
MNPFYVREVKAKGRPRLYFYEVRNGKAFRLFKSSLSLSEIKEHLLNRVQASYKLTKKTIYTEDERLFKTLVVYGGVRQGTMNPSASRIMDLSKAVASLDEFSLQFWYTEFVSRYQRRNNLLDTYRVGKAFRDLYE